MDPTSPNHPSESKREERRQYSRTKVAVAVELQSDKASTPLRLKTADLSIGGLYVEMMFTLEVGTKLKIVLWIKLVTSAWVLKLKQFATDFCTVTVENTSSKPAKAAYGWDTFSGASSYPPNALTG